MKIGRILVLLVILAGGVALGVHFWHRHKAHKAGATAAAQGQKGDTAVVYDSAAYNTHAPQGVRIKVEVLNATKRSGLGRQATLYLRDRGFDVVDIGTSRRQQDKTLVLDRSNHPEWAQLVAKAMHATEASRPDTSAYLDATILVGSDWSPPSQPFYP